MYEFVETESGWIVCWGPTPAEQTRAVGATPAAEVESAEAGADAADVISPLAV